MKLKGRYAVITGANQGFGEQIARGFVREGASVLLCARGEKLLESVRKSLDAGRKADQKIVAMSADVTREEDIRAVVKRALQEFPHVDILVNCAGVAGPRGTIDSVNWEEWKQAIRINLDGTVFACLSFLPHMKARRAGKIINISGGGATKPLPQLSAYAASKAGVVRFTETLAHEVRDFGIDVNAISPGVLATRMVDHFLEVGAETLGQKYVDEVQRQKADGQDSFDLAAGLCVYLASAESDGITGRLISAAWDPWENLHTHREELAASDIYTLRRIVPEDRGATWGKVSR